LRESLFKKNIQLINLAKQQKIAEKSKNKTRRETLAQLFAFVFLVVSKNKNKCK